MGSFFSGPQGTIALSVTLIAITAAGLFAANNTWTGTNIFSSLITANGGEFVKGLVINYSNPEITFNYTPKLSDDVIYVNVTSGTKVITLPYATGNMSGKIFMIKQVGYSAGNVVTINPPSGKSLNGNGGFNMTHVGSTIIVQSNGSAWNTVTPRQINALEYQVRGSTTQWVGAIQNSANTATQLTVASTLYAIPWQVTNPIKIDKLSAEITTAANTPSNTCRLGIYQDSGNDYPTALVATSDAGTSTTTVKVHSYNYSTPITLQVGLYYQALACSTDGVAMPTFRSASASAIPNVLGCSSSMGLNSCFVAYRFTTFTYGALPSTFPAGATLATGNNITPPLILAEVTKG